MSGIERRPIEAHVVDQRGYHPMTLAGTCLSCGRSEMASGCEVRDRATRTAEMVRRGLSEALARDLRHVDAEMFTQLEEASDGALVELSKLYDERERAADASAVIAKDRS